MRSDYVDILWVHVWDRHTPLEETLRGLYDAVSARCCTWGSRTRPRGSSRANTLAQWRDRTPFAGLQVPYNLLDRDVERELLPMAEAVGMSVTAWAPLAAGKLSGATAAGSIRPR